VVLPVLAKELNNTRTEEIQELLNQLIKTFVALEDKSPQTIPHIMDGFLSTIQRQQNDVNQPLSYTIVPTATLQQPVSTELQPQSEIGKILLERWRNRVETDPFL